jgi:glucosamine--fructose-6-phosphate aminotransferase (isomerizing)
MLIREDYTERMMEEQLKNQLIDQSLKASSFIQEVWPKVLDDARDITSSYRQDIPEILICGCGDSHHAAAGVEMAFEIWSHRMIRSASAMFASRYLVPRVKSRASQCLVIGISASGEVARTIEVVQLAKATGARTLAFTSNRDSTLAKLADDSLVIETPLFEGPGLLSYLASLLMGFAVCGAISESKHLEEMQSTMKAFPSVLEPWIRSELEVGKHFAKDIDRQTSCVFVAGGSLFGSAMFSAAKAIESAGIHAWAQELEEWAHIEYFCEPADMPTWFLTAEGRTGGRELEVVYAAETLGRNIQVSRWKGSSDWSSRAREALAPLALWPGPVAFASAISEGLGEKPFRGFGGGRSVVEGGGVSRIRSSERIVDLRDFDE